MVFAIWYDCKIRFILQFAFGHSTNMVMLWAYLSNYNIQTFMVLRITVTIKCKCIISTISIFLMYVDVESFVTMCITNRKNWLHFALLNNEGTIKACWVYSSKHRHKTNQNHPTRKVLFYPFIIDYNQSTRHLANLFFLHYTLSFEYNQSIGLFKVISISNILKCIGFI